MNMHEASTPSLRSPICVLEHQIAAAAFKLAPERDTLLAAEASGFSLILSDDRGFNVRVNTETHASTLPIATLEYIWACTFLLLRLYDFHGEEQRAGAQAMDLAKDAEICSRLDLFNWALNNMREDGTRT